MKKVILSIAFASILLSCSNSSEIETTTEAPATYSFERNGVSTVDFNGQTTRIQMANEFISDLKTTSETVVSLNAKFAHAEGDNDFSDADLNASSKNIRSKTAASTDFYASNTTDANAIKAEFDSWIAEQVNDVFPNWSVNASAGVAGKIQEAGGGSERFVNAKGLELNQMINKSLIGGLMVDQILNNYLSTAVLDAGSNTTDNDDDIVASDKVYTNMEHKWDEAFGYLYGNESDITAPVLNVDSFLNKYLSRVEGDTDFTGIASDIYDAFKLGRAAIVAKDYTTRDAQAEIIREKISEIIAIRAVYYLQQAKATLGTDNASAFHDLSEGLGFVYSLQFTRQTSSDAPYFSKTEVDAFVDTLLAGNGFWDVTDSTLDTISTTIAAKFNFTVTEAAN
ncbi:DUF4856 domain-containing protein [Polaribacter sp. Hel1_85]|uniref:DUF4856 domain-containing protein n=1 Tax=Polaribacter sp. Hel1_85 TaxID=1250005 RepID=UPI00052D28C5|nr:DUF4856 domain-containing protein [Polaribacter sp. Hel1_85]KGL63278.1 hypothetical protein PHEL85_0312 [Polaribacter sp. Hel1_85]